MEQNALVDFYAQGERLDALFGHELAFPELPLREPNPAVADAICGVGIFLLACSFAAMLAYLFSAWSSQSIKYPWFC